MKYWFEWGGTCLWSANDAAKKEFNYAVDEQKLPISAKLKKSSMVFAGISRKYDGYGQCSERFSMVDRRRYRYV